MIIFIKVLLALGVIGWLALGVFLLVKYEGLFGKHPDDPSETAGARSLNMTQVWSCWLGFFGILLYFLFT